MYDSPQATSQTAFDYQPYLDYRVRIERRIDRDFASNINDDRTDAYNRLRPGLKWKYGKRWSGDLQYQLAHNAIWKVGKAFSDEASDLNLAYARYQNATIDATIGRQKINIGSERLIGSLEWSMTARAFDGLRIKTGPLDAYAFKVGVAYPKNTKTTVAGASVSHKLGLTSVIFKHDDGLTFDTENWTLSHLWQAKTKQWSLEAEAAVQQGTVGTKDLDAWAAHGQIGYAVSKSTKAAVEFNAASGGGTATKTRTFDNLLPTNHKFYGSMDLQAWKNMEELAVGVEHQLNPKWAVKSSFHSFKLHDSRDAWYGAGGAANQGPNGAYVDATGLSGRDVGSELDLEFSYKHTATISVSGGLGLFNPGSFVKARNGGSANRQTWGYLAVQFRF